MYTTVTDISAQVCQYLDQFIKSANRLICDTSFSMDKQSAHNEQLNALSKVMLVLQAYEAIGYKFHIWTHDSEYFASAESLLITKLDVYRVVDVDGQKQQQLFRTIRFAVDERSYLKR